MMECCNFTCENHKVDNQKVILNTIVNMFINNKVKISAASVRKDKVVSFKKQTNNFFVIFFNNYFVPTPMYVRCGGGGVDMTTN